MKAVKIDGYGGAEQIKIVEVPQIAPKANEVLIRVITTVVTPADVAFREGKPWIARLFSGLLRPKTIPGVEYAGVVELVGASVTRFQAGDRVLGVSGTAFGAHAEYIVQAESGVLSVLPNDINFADAVGLCDGPLTALVFLRDHAKLQPGQSIVINGASGAVGSAAVQMAKQMGAIVTAVCSARNFELVESLGADYLVDYTKQDFAQSGRTYDVIYDAVGKRSFADCRDALSADGVYMTTAPTLNIIGAMLQTKLFGKKRALFVAAGLNQTVANLEAVVASAEANTLQSVIDRTYPFSQIANAHRFVETGRKRGNCIVEISPL